MLAGLDASAGKCGATATTAEDGDRAGVRDLPTRRGLPTTRRRTYSASLGTSIIPSSIRRKRPARPDPTRKREGGRTRQRARHGRAVCGEPSFPTFPEATRTPQNRKASQAPEHAPLDGQRRAQVRSTESACDVTTHDDSGRYVRVRPQTWKSVARLEDRPRATSPSYLPELPPSYSGYGSVVARTVTRMSTTGSSTTKTRKV